MYEEDFKYFLLNPIRVIKNRVKNVEFMYSVTP